MKFCPNVEYFQDCMLHSVFWLARHLFDPIWKFFCQANSHCLYSCPSYQGDLLWKHNIMRNKVKSVHPSLFFSHYERNNNEHWIMSEILAALSCLLFCNLHSNYTLNTFLCRAEGKWHYKKQCFILAVNSISILRERGICQMGFPLRRFLYLIPICYVQGLLFT